MLESLSNHILTTSILNPIGADSIFKDIYNKQVSPVRAESYYFDVYIALWKPFLTFIFIIIEHLYQEQWIHASQMNVNDPFQLLSLINTSLHYIGGHFEFYIILWKLFSSLVFIIIELPCPEQGIHAPPHNLNSPFQRL